MEFKKNINNQMGTYGIQQNPMESLEKSFGILWNQTESYGIKVNPREFP